MGVIHAAAAGHIFTASQFTTGTELEDGIEQVDIDSTPAAMPTSYAPLLIIPAIFMKAWSPLAHCLLVAETGIELGNPASSIPIRAITAPPPGWRTFPTQISLTVEWVTLTRLISPLRTSDSSRSASIPLSEPFFALVMGDRHPAIITIAPLVLEEDDEVVLL
jgi:hypothetical protein